MRVETLPSLAGEYWRALSHSKPGLAYGEEIPRHTLEVAALRIDPAALARYRAFIGSSEAFPLAYAYVLAQPAHFHLINQPEFPVRCVTQSTADYGLGGYGIHLVPPLVTYVGREAVDVAAGTFQGLHFRVRWSDQVPKYSDFWVSDDFVPLRLLGASGDVSYELFELDGSL